MTYTYDSRADAIAAHNDGGPCEPRGDPVRRGAVVTGIQIAYVPVPGCWCMGCQVMRHYEDMAAGDDDA